MQYDIEADWHLLDTCNYRCSYCFYSDELLGRKVRTFATPAEWGRAFDATGLTWLIHLTGGEPAIYPQFARLCAELTENHYVSFNSNLDHASIREFGETVDPRRVSFVNASLHYDERAKRKGFDKFIRNTLSLRERGFPVFASVVATPEVLARMEEILALLGPSDIVPVPKLLRGPHAGRSFPSGYSEEERASFRRYSALAREHYRTFLEGLPEMPTINPFFDDAFVSALPSYRGRDCDAGHRFVRVLPDGRVHRCAAEGLGNLRDGTFGRRLQPQACDTSYCFYFCEKHSRAKSALSPHPIMQA